MEPVRPSIPKMARILFSQPYLPMEDPVEDEDRRHEGDDRRRRTGPGLSPPLEGPGGLECDGHREQNRDGEGDRPELEGDQGRLVNIGSLNSLTQFSNPTNSIGSSITRS